MPSKDVRIKFNTIHNDHKHKENDKETEISFIGS